jgi:hypothetical protein
MPQEVGCEDIRTLPFALAIQKVSKDLVGEQPY